jgi:hypothetical protein
MPRRAERGRRCRVSLVEKGECRRTPGPSSESETNESTIHGRKLGARGRGGVPRHGLHTARKRTKSPASLTTTPVSSCAEQFINSCDLPVVRSIPSLPSGGGSHGDSAELAAAPLPPHSALQFPTEIHPALTVTEIRQIFIDQNIGLSNEMRFLSDHPHH